MTTTASEKERLTKLEKMLLKLLREVAQHVAARDAMGNPSQGFCKGCLTGGRRSCPMERVWRAIEELGE